MAYALLFAFVAVPMLEIAIFVQVGGLIGLLPTLGLVLLTAVLGTALLRSQGFRVLQSARATIEAGGFPAKQLFDGACLLVGGVLLLTPGFFTDTVGLLLLLPPFREILRGAAMRHAGVRYGRAGFTGSGPFDGDDMASGRNRPSGGRPGDGTVIEGDYDEVDRSSAGSPPDGDPPCRRSLDDGRAG